MEMYLNILDNGKVKLSPCLEPPLRKYSLKNAIGGFPYFEPKVCGRFGRYSWDTQGWRCGEKGCYFPYEGLFWGYLETSENVYNIVVTNENTIYT